MFSIMVNNFFTRSYTKNGQIGNIIMTGHRTGTRTIFAPTGGFRIPTITEIKRKREGGFGSREITRKRER